MRRKRNRGRSKRTRRRRKTTTKMMATCSALTPRKAQVEMEADAQQPSLLSSF
jgi:hypothetical protein